MGSSRSWTAKWQAAIYCAVAISCGGTADKPGAAHPAPRPALTNQAPEAPAAAEATTAHAPPADQPIAVPIDPPIPNVDALAAAKPPANEPPEFTAIKNRILGGDHGGKAIKDLQRLNGKYPSCVDIPYLLGQLYLEKLWVGDGLKAFRKALEIDPSFHSNPFLIRAALNGLGNDRDHHQVQRFLTQDIGSPAAPYLEEVLYGDWRQQVKERAAAVLREIP